MPTKDINRGYYYFLIPGLILFLLIIGIPFLMNIGISLTKWNGIGKMEWVGLSNYKAVLTDKIFWASFRNNVAMIFSVVVVPTLGGLMLAVLLFDYVSVKISHSLTSVLRAGYYLPQILPVAIAGVVWGWILNPNYGALNWLLDNGGLSQFTHNWLGEKATALPSVMMIMIWFQLGYPLVIFMSAMQRVDPQILEAALIDGANWFQRFKIIMVLIFPEISVVVLTTTIHALKIFAQIFVLTRGGPGHATLVPSYFAYQNFFEKAKVGYGSAISTVMTTLILLLTLVFIRIQFKQEKESGV
ncbi:carbohydrate ABC transporter permease [Spirochaeta cellobiosiphila]|uniref:carbohydrate ABC transporter permease n=1 Tax=Spirochaeta cellobiosiphila TaxID=504483 RepID=UPI0003FEAD36|nr:sugar ABC transporter permease [Spirochaeta cellobiosiphila]